MASRQILLDAIDQLGEKLAKSEEAVELLQQQLQDCAEKLNIAERELELTRNELDKATKKEECAIFSLEQIKVESEHSDMNREVQMELAGKDREINDLKRDLSGVKNELDRRKAVWDRETKARARVDAEYRSRINQYKAEIDFLKSMNEKRKNSSVHLPSPSESDVSFGESREEAEESMTREQPSCSRLHSSPRMSDDGFPLVSPPRIGKLFPNLQPLASPSTPLRSTKNASRRASDQGAPPKRDGLLGNDTPRKRARFSNGAVEVINEAINILRSESKGARVEHYNIPTNSKRMERDIDECKEIQLQVFSFHEIDKLKEAATNVLRLLEKWMPVNSSDEAQWLIDNGVSDRIKQGAKAVLGAELSVLQAILFEREPKSIIPIYRELTVGRKRDSVRPSRYK